MKKDKAFVALYFLVTCVIRLNLSGAVFYVAPGGNDNHSGSRQEPWATPGYASRQLQPGDTLILRGGRYVLSVFNDDIVIPASGTSNAWITIRGEAGERAILAGRDNLYSAVILAGKSYLRLENLEITHDEQAAGNGIFFREGVNITGPPSRHIVLQDLYIHHLDQFGLDVQDVEDLQLIHCRIEYCGFGAVGGPRGEAGGLRQLSVRGCSLSYSGHYYQGGTVCPCDRPDGFGIEPSDGPVEIVDTIAEHNLGDGLDSKANNTTIRRCLVANNFADGVKLWGGGSRVENTLIHGRGDCNPLETPWAPIVIDSVSTNGNFTLVNLTVDDAFGQTYLLHAQYDVDVPINLTVRNCVFRSPAARTRLWVRNTVRLTADHNLFYLPNTVELLYHGQSTYTTNNIASLGAGNRHADPLFVPWPCGQRGDYRVRAGSPLIDSGSAADAPSHDLVGAQRDAWHDIGAYEYLVPVRLDLFRSGNFVVLSWPSSAETFVLQEAPQLSGSPGWVTVTNPPGLVGGLRTVTNVVTGMSRFYRLISKSEPASAP